MTKKRYVGVTDRGDRVGETHHRAKLTDHDIKLIRQLRRGGMTMPELANKFDVTKGYISQLLQGRTRAQWVADWREVYIGKKKRSRVKK